MTPQQTIDPYDILTSLGVQNASDASRVTGGADTLLWRVVWNDQPYALRLLRADQGARFDHEVALMQMAASSGIAVPDMVRQGMWENRPVMLLSWVDGRPLAEQLQANPASGWALGQAYGRTHAAIHQISAPASTNTDGWIEWAGDEPELKARLYDLKSRPARLLHLDYHPLNVMAHGNRISGVLDWANAQFGDPRADIARTYTILRVEPYGPVRDSLKLALFRRLLERAWRTGYVQAAGQLDDMALFYAWAGAVMIRDLGVRIGQPGHWLESHHLDPVRRWRDAWKRRAGIRR